MHVEVLKHFGVQCVALKQLKHNRFLRAIACRSLKGIAANLLHDELVCEPLQTEQFTDVFGIALSAANNTLPVRALFDSDLPLTR